MVPDGLMGGECHPLVNTQPGPVHREQLEVWARFAGAY